MTEHDFIKAMAEDFKSQHLGSFWRKIHGHEYQAGFPDVLAALPDVAALCEFKFCKDDNKLVEPLGPAIKSMLTGLQYAELTMLAALSATCPLRARVCIGCEIEDEAGQEFQLALGCDVDDLSRYRTFSAVSIAGVALHARRTGLAALELKAGENDKAEWIWPKDEFPSGAPVGLEFQLRARGERWRVGQLVLGMRRYKVFDVRTKIDPEMSYE